MDHASDAKYRQYLETLGEDAVRHQLSNQTMQMTVEMVAHYHRLFVEHLDVEPHEAD